MKNCCTICREPVVLNPSATERAKRLGGKPSDYASIFQQHSACTIRVREQEATAPMRAIVRGCTLAK